MSKEVRPDRVAIYIRWSTEDQGDGTSLEVQQEACSHFILSQGWTLRKDLVFIDDGYSGGNLRRPAITALRRAVAGAQVDCVVVFKLDRLSRSVVDTVNLVLEEWESRCYCKSAREPIDTATPAGKMFFYLLASYAEWERSVIRERTAGGRLQKAAQGFWAVGRPPYGYRVDQHKHLVTDAAEAAVVKAIYAAYLKGRTMGDIVQQLRSEGAPAPGGPGAWSKEFVRRVLGLPIYTGLLQYGKSPVNPRYGRDQSAPRRLRGVTPAVSLAGAAPVIIDQRTYEAVQHLKAQRDARKTRSSGRAYSSPWLLSGIAKCARCGASFYARASHAGRHPYYYCTGRKGKLPCDCVMIPVQMLDEWFVQELKRVYGDQVRRQEVFCSLEAEQAGRLAALQASLEATQAAVAQLDKERAVIRRRFRADEISAHEYRQFLAEIDGESRGHAVRVLELEAELARVRATEQVHNLAGQLAAVDVFETLATKDKKHLVFSLVHALAVYRAPQGREIQTRVTWKLPLAPLEIAAGDGPPEASASSDQVQAAGPTAYSRPRSQR